MGRDNRRTRLLLFALLATALALITVDYRVNGADSRLRSGLHDVVGPIERHVSRAPATPIRQIHVFPFGGLKKSSEWLVERGSWSLAAAPALRAASL